MQNWQTAQRWIILIFHYFNSVQFEMTGRRAMLFGFARHTLMRMPLAQRNSLCIGKCSSSQGNSSWILFRPGLYGEKNSCTLRRANLFDPQWYSVRKRQYQVTPERSISKESAVVDVEIFVCHWANHLRRERRRRSGNNLVLFNIELRRIQSVCIYI